MAWVLASVGGRRAASAESPAPAAVVNSCPRPGALDHARQIP